MSLIKIQSSDGQVFDIKKDIISQSVTIKNMFEDMEQVGSDASIHIIPIPNVTGSILNKVIEYCTYHQDHPNPVSDDKRTDDITPWDSNFCNIDQTTLFELILAANYMDNKPLLELTCKTVANMIKGKTPEEIRKTFNIENDFTPEEEEEIKKQNEWCEEK